MTFYRFRVWRDEERTRLDTETGLLGWGVQFPTGRCVVEWRREAFAEDDRLEHPHMSEYGCIDDVEQGTGGNVEKMVDHP